MVLLAFKIGAGASKAQNNLTNTHRNHYDSVIHIGPDQVFTMSENLVERIKRSFINDSLQNESIVDLTE